MSYHITDFLPYLVELLSWDLFTEFARLCFVVKIPLRLFTFEQIFVLKTVC